MKWPFFGRERRGGEGIGGGEEAGSIMHYHLFEVVTSCRPSSSPSSKKAAQMAD